MVDQNQVDQKFRTVNGHATHLTPDHVVHDLMHLVVVSKGTYNHLSNTDKPNLSHCRQSVKALDIISCHLHTYAR